MTDWTICKLVNLQTGRFALNPVRANFYKLSSSQLEEPRVDLWENRLATLNFSVLINMNETEHSNRESKKVLNAMKQNKLNYLVTCLPQIMTI